MNASFHAQTHQMHCTISIPCTYSSSESKNKASHQNEESLQKELLMAY